MSVGWPTSIVVLGLLVAGTSMAWTEIYKWRDAEGRLHYSQNPPPDTEALKLRPHAGFTAPPPAASVDEVDAAEEPLTPTQQFLQQAEERRAKKAQEQARAAEARKEAAIKCELARQEQRFFAERPPQRIGVRSEDGSIARMSAEQASARKAQIARRVEEFCR